MHNRRIKYERFLLLALALSAACHLLAALVPAGAVDLIFSRDTQPSRTVRFQVVRLREEPMQVLKTRKEERPPVPRAETFKTPPLPRPRLTAEKQLAVEVPDLRAFVRPETEIAPLEQPAEPSVFNADSTARMDSYISEVLARIEQARMYPETARRMGQQGQVEVAFAIGRDGALNKPASLVEPSPFAALNRAACNSISRSSPFPSLPPCIRTDTLPLVVTIKFELH